MIVWREEDHPRDSLGRFVEVGEGSGTGTLKRASGSIESVSPEIRKKAESFVKDFVRISPFSDKAKFSGLQKEGSEWARTGGGKYADELNALYSDTQAKLAEQGVDSVRAYRGVTLPADHPLAKAILSGGVKHGYEVNLEGMDLRSWSEEHHIAGRFANSLAAQDKKGIGLLISRDIPRADVVASWRTQEGFFEHEKEVVAASVGPTKVRIIGAIHGKTVVAPRKEHLAASPTR